jgi:medium-chain acyl-[acyl-carrier-protein] hydrolase
MKTGSQGDAWIFGARPAAQARLRLFCFPNAGGGASMYCPWVQALAPEIEVCPVQLPGRENRIYEQAFAQFDDLVDALACALAPRFDKPFAFFGHSMGALLSFGLARHLMRQGQPVPVQLFLSAYRAPHIPNDEMLHLLSDAALVRTIMELNGTQRGVLENPELRQLLLPIFRADFGVCETYVHTQEEPLPIPMTVFGGLQDARVSQPVLDAWRVQTSASFALHMLPGDHFFWRGNPQPVWQAITQAYKAQFPQAVGEGAFGR